VLAISTIGQSMGPGGHDRDGLMGDTEINHELVMELALSAGPAELWRFDVTTGNFTCMPGLDDVLGMPGADEQAVRTRLAELLVGLAVDVSGQRDYEQALTDRYRLLVDVAPEGIVVHQGGHLVYVNPAVVRFMRAGSAAELLGRPIVDFVHPDSVPAMLRRISALTVPGATSEPAEAVLLRCDGGTLDVESVSVRTTWDGRPAYRVIMRDVTAEKAAAAALRYQAALVAHISDALVATTVEGTVTSWNPSAETVYGHRAEEATVPRTRSGNPSTRWSVPRSIPPPCSTRVAWSRPSTAVPTAPRSRSASRWRG
jgi:PAS domain S-box-containing protein